MKSKIPGPNQQMINDFLKGWTEQVDMNSDGTARLVRRYYLERDAVLASFSFGRRKMTYTLTKKQLTLKQTTYSSCIYEIEVHFTKEQAKKSKLLCNPKKNYSYSIPFSVMTYKTF